LKGRGFAVALLFALVASAPASAAQGSLLGLVEDPRGAPVAGAVVSLFGKGLAGGGVVTLTDGAGRFVLAALPPGSYTLRALSAGHKPAQAQQVTVLPDQESSFKLTLAEAAQEEAERTIADSAASRELRWLVRHKRRSVLEERTEETGRVSLDVTPHADAVALTGTLELVATPPEDVAGSSTLPGNLGALHLRGRFLDTGRWALSGLVTEAEGRTWRMSGEFVVEPTSDRTLSFGTGYGTAPLRSLPLGDAANPQDNRSVGASFVHEDRRLSNSVSVGLGARHTYVGFLRDSNHFDPDLAVRWDDGTNRVRGSLSRRTVIPGGDPLAVSTLATPALAMASISDDLRAERLLRYEIVGERRIGHGSVQVSAFREDGSDPLVTEFLRKSSLLVRNTSASRADGLGLGVSRSFGRAISASLAYTYARAHRSGGEDLVAGCQGECGSGGLHDVVARVETVLDGTGTHFLALYRISSLSPVAPEAADAAPRSVANTRFDIQLRQDLPFLESLTRAEWDLLFAVRNLVYEGGEGSTLDEMAVVNPPTRLMGGFAVRF
jgi:hypothetical protein